jgi:hypothetical protein
VTLLEAPEPPSRLPSNSLLADSVARLASAATVEAVFAVKLAVELEVLLVLAVLLAEVASATAEAWLLLTLPIDIMTPIAAAGIRAIGRNSKNLTGDPHRRQVHLWRIRKTSRMHQQIRVSATVSCGIPDRGTRQGELASEPEKYQHRAIQTHDVFIIEASDLRPDLGFCDGCNFVDHETARACQAVSLIGRDGQSK